MEAILMTSWSLWTVLLSACTERLVSFQFCCCLIQFECENKFESVSAFTIKFFCADTLQGFQGPDLQW
ncbi:hypothetical protein, partial [Thiolapillus sp.]|uniref:hypothetical protein n=2 Tax=Thiolapillus sp. TaxID=2017437 RepID=UPI003AF5B246